MAGQLSGVSAQPSRTLALPAQRQLQLLPPATTRTRRNHGAFTLGGQLACVYSTRRSGECNDVGFELGAGTLTLASTMTAVQARNLARALLAAADAIESGQQACAASSQEGGAA